jgi:hypothetical protein
MTLAHSQEGRLVSPARHLPLLIPMALNSEGRVATTELRHFHPVDIGWQFVQGSGGRDRQGFRLFEIEVRLVQNGITFPHSRCAAKSSG